MPYVPPENNNVFSAKRFYPVLEDESERTTKDGIEVKVGQVWRDLDKRRSGRECKVAEIRDGKAVMRPVSLREDLCLSTKLTTVSISRMHKHSTGWQLVLDV